jgi:hypothetical protein
MHFFKLLLKIGQYIIFVYISANMNYFDVTLDQCSGCNYEKTYCNCENTLQAFCKTNM